MTLVQWVRQNCKFAAFNAPRKGDRIEISTMPGQYWLILKVDLGNDPRGGQFWQAEARGGEEGGQRKLFSDQIGSWSHWRGEQYEWDRQDQDRVKFERERKEQSGLIQAFEAKYRFPDGQPLRKSVGRPMVVTVGDNAQELAAFAGERLYVKDIDYRSENVRLEPVKEEFMEFASHLSAVPAAVVVAESAPTMRAEVAMEPVKLPGGQRITAAELMNMTPDLNRLAVSGRVHLTVQVYANYENAAGEGGEDRFIREMGLRGIEPEEVQMLTQYRVNNVAATVDETGRRTNIFGAWQGNVYIDPPISPEVETEIRQIAPASAIQKARSGQILVQSNPLYKQMVSLGVLANSAPGRAEQVPAA